MFANDNANHLQSLSSQPGGTLTGAKYPLSHDTSSHYHATTSLSQEDWAGFTHEGSQNFILVNDVYPDLHPVEVHHLPEAYGTSVEGFSSGLEHSANFMLVDEVYPGSHLRLPASYTTPMEGFSSGLEQSVNFMRVDEVYPDLCNMPQVWNQ
jgi:hypothetical protein